MYAFKILSEISKVLFKISHKILNPYSAQYAVDDILEIWPLKCYWDGPLGTILL